MKFSTIIQRITHIEILSALLWASVILVAGFLLVDPAMISTLITAAGLHVVLLSNHKKSIK
ncbi:MAG: hypothetical protein HRT65_01435 [Flavobacteriaceae bacterium]|nr:hypothetical protein [Flavobacteriaceae bacterium]